MKKMQPYFHIVLLLFFIHTNISAQHQHDAARTGMLPVITNVEAQPLLSHAKRLDEALTFLGSALTASDAARIRQLQLTGDGQQTITAIQRILDPYCLAMVDINPEARVKVFRGPAKAALMQNGWTSFLVKVRNDAGVTAQLNAQSANAEPVLHGSTSAPRVQEKNILSKSQVVNRFLEMSIYRNRPLQPELSGLRLEYAVLQIYSKDAGKREAELAFNVGQGSQDIGFRNAIHILFDIKRSVKVLLSVKDDDGSPAMASFLFKDGIERVLRTDTSYQRFGKDYRTIMAQQEFSYPVKGLTGIYPLPSRRVAAFDEFPDFFFQPQVYRSDGEHISLPPGKYDVTYTRGPEYIPQHKQIEVPANKDSVRIAFQLKRWIRMSDLGWYSGDHHVHAAGCSHYESPEEGVPPMHMWRQILGEDLNVGAVLTWGPSWYHQKNYFTGKVSPMSTRKNVMRYDIEVSGFPSSHAGHVVLLQLKEDDFPGTKTIEEWPSWTLPVFQWAKSQGGVAGYAHSGWGLEPMQPVDKLPNDVVPKMDGIGANEYIVTVAHNVVDFYSLGDTPAPWELNILYHTLNCGFKTKISGETDFPCIFDERVGIARSYFRTGKALSFESYIEGIKSGKSYVSDGSSHIIDVLINGDSSREVSFNSPQQVEIAAKVTAYLPEKQDELSADIQQRKPDEQPYWHIERARVGKSRKVPVELIVNGEAVAKSEIEADGKWKDVRFNYNVDRSSWVALRVYQSSHTNPFFVSIGGKPVAVKKSAEWCVKALDQCWKKKQPAIREAERKDAEAAYTKARAVYEKIAAGE